MTELDEAIELANRTLDRINADPDDDLAILSRQFLRAIEREGALRTQNWDAMIDLRNRQNGT